MPDRTAPTIGFIGPYAPAAWEKGRIPGGTASIAELPDDPAGCRFEYRVKLTGGGVPQRATRFQVRAAASGIVSFDYRFEFYHAWYQVTAQFDVFAETDCDLQTLKVLQFVGPQSVGPKVFHGSAAIHVQAGRNFGVILGGSNFDSDSRLEGTLTLTDFAAPINGPWVPPTTAVVAEAVRRPDESPLRRRRRSGEPSEG